MKKTEAKKATPQRTIDQLIYVGNDEVEVMLNLHKLMDVLTPLPLTIKEKRDNIAHKYKTSRVKLDINSLNLAV